VAPKAEETPGAAPKVDIFPAADEKGVDVVPPNEKAFGAALPKDIPL